jgi:hypothetical protein
VNAQLEVVLIAAGCTSGVGLMGLGVIRLLRRASLRLSLQVSGAIVVLAVVGGTLGTAEAMFLSAHDLRVVIMVCMVAAVVAVGFGCLIGQQLQAGSLALRQAARSLGDLDGGYRSPAGPMMAELASSARPARSWRSPARGSTLWTSPGASSWRGSRTTCARRWPACTRWPRR